MKRSRRSRKPSKKKKTPKSSSRAKRGLPSDIPTKTVKQIVRAARPEGAAQTLRTQAEFGPVTYIHPLAAQIRDIEASRLLQAEADKKKDLPKIVPQIERKLQDKVVDDLVERLPSKHPLRRTSLVLDESSYRSAVLPPNFSVASHRAPQAYSDVLVRGSRA